MTSILPASPCLYKLVRHHRLSPSEIQSFDSAIAAAKLDPFIGDIDFTDASLLNNLLAIVREPGRDVAGFFAPRRQMASGALHWRCGPLFIVPSLRGQGVMASALRDFFSSRRPGLVWIDDANDSSKLLFSRLGFVKAKPLTHDGRAGHWHALPMPI